MHRQQQSNETTAKKVQDVVRRLEEGLFKTAATKVCYLCFVYVNITRTAGHRLSKCFSNFRAEIYLCIMS